MQDYATTILFEHLAYENDGITKYENLFSYYEEEYLDSFNSFDPTKENPDFPHLSDDVSEIIDDAEFTVSEFLNDYTIEEMVNDCKGILCGEESKTNIQDTFVDFSHERFALHIEDDGIEIDLWNYSNKVSDALCNKVLVPFFCNYVIRKYGK